MSYKALLLDMETLGAKPNTVILDLAAIVFNVEDEDNFETLCNDESRLFRVKFDVADQVKLGRTICEDTLNWWSNQSDNAKLILKPSPFDVSLSDGFKKFEQYLKDHKVDENTLGFVRGASFDFKIIDNVVEMLKMTGYPEGCFPVKFYNQRDVRTAISFALQTLYNTRCPLPVGLFDKFVKHNSIHDCARDVISLQTAWAYANGSKEIPEKFELY